MRPKRTRTVGTAHTTFAQRAAIQQFYTAIFILFIGLLFWAQFYGVLPNNYPVWGIFFTLVAVWLFIKAFWLASK